jgi:hypothetical protein
VLPGAAKAAVTHPPASVTLTGTQAGADTRLPILLKEAARSLMERARRAVIRQTAGLQNLPRHQISLTDADKKNLPHLLIKVKFRMLVESIFLFLVIWYNICVYLRKY